MGDTGPSAGIGLCIHLLGGFRVAVEGCPIPPSAWRLRKGASLLKLLALAPHYQLHREQVLDWLWPDLEVEAAGNNLRYTLHMTRRLLGAPAQPTAQWLQLQGSLLVLGPPGSIWTDVAAFAGAAEAARRTQEPACYRAAIALYGGELLPEDRYEDWAVRQREALHREYLALWLQLAGLEEAEGKRDAAIAALTQVVTAEPTYEEAHRGLMRLYAETGQRQQALRQYAQLRDVVRRELDGEPDLESQRLHAAILAGRVVSRPAPGSGPASPPVCGLPLPLTSFVGRGQEVAEVAHLLAATRLLTLTGVGGVGKTRLALAVAARVQDAYADGVWLVDLAPLADPALVPQAVAQVVGVREQPGRSLTETLAARLASRHLLLVLDNCEHLVPACAVLADALLRACPHLRLLVTSRERLGLDGEVPWRVPSLALPARPDQGQPEELVRVDAIRLFVERARTLVPEFSLTPGTAAAVTQVCRQLDGIPLALELAAARVPVLAVEEIIARLDDRFRLLTSGSRTALPRQQTLRATLDWSYELLTPRERALFRRLAVFAGGWTLAAAEAVGAGTGIEQGEVLDLLARLVDKSLVVAEAHGGETRYRLLETVRQYAWERLQEAQETAVLQRRHCDWYLLLTERAEPAVWGGAEQLRWLARLDAEQDNLRAALAWCQADDPAAGLELAGRLWQFWRVRGVYTEGRRWLEHLVVQAPERTVQRVKALLGIGVLAYWQGDVSTARARLEESVALSRALGDRRFIAWSLRELGGQPLYRLGDYRQARAMLEEGLALIREVGDQRGLGANLGLLGLVARAEGDYRRARALIEEGLEVVRAVGDRWLIAPMLELLGGVVLLQGDYGRARTLGEEGLAVAQEMGTPWQTARLHWHLGRVAQLQGDLVEAAAQYEAGLRLARDHEDAYWRAWNLAGLGWVALLAGDAARATVRLQDSLALANDLGDKRGLSLVLHALGLVAWSQDDVVQATLRLRESLTLRRQLGDRLGIAECLEGLALVAGGQGAAAGATRLLGAAAALRQAIGVPQPPIERAAYEATVGAARAVLGEQRFAMAWTAGQALPLEQALHEALAWEPVPAPALPLSLPRTERALGQPAGACLTAREQEIAALVARGLTNRQIAIELSISERTAGTHLANILGKLGFATRAQVAVWVVDQGLRPAQPG